MLEKNRIFLGDCLEIMRDIDDKSIDCIIADLPYGTTACKWDTVIPFEPLWKHYERIIKDTGVVVLFGNQPFSSMLITSNLKMFKYSLVWNKRNTGCPVVAKKRPLPIHEDIHIFAKGKTVYNPIKTDLDRKRKWKQYANSQSIPIANPGEGETVGKYPVSIIDISNANRKGRLHPTEKPAELYKYLLNTYSNEGDLVLDNCCGSGTIGIAQTIGRNFIGIEKDEQYFKVACERIEKFKVS